MAVVASAGGCAADYAGASAQARQRAETVRISVEEGTTGVTPSRQALADDVAAALRAHGASGDVFSQAVEDGSTVVGFWVDGTIQSNGGVFQPPDARVRLCVELVSVDGGGLELRDAECAGRALPVPEGRRVIRL